MSSTPLLIQANSVLETHGSNLQDQHSNLALALDLPLGSYRLLIRVWLHFVTSSNRENQITQNYSLRYLIDINLGV